ncbi:hypothetical protein [Alicyclobacillus sp. SO9]|uniref:hypothetical protein n=1 Tax=Alicyclobacillus sp. SO9 TaxID=2665646 RepID=UPI0018E80359|nr:hypothetical protein [Alicyclobacillus sp. SO9]QQE79700.1 hypothetical protein GI364_04210 [Alicyclobacillus sp. SO9]
MVNLERKTPILALAVENPPAEEWLRGELGQFMEVASEGIRSPDDVLGVDVDLVLVARRAAGSDVGIEAFGETLEAAAAGGTDVIAIVGNLDEEGHEAVEVARTHHAWAVLTSDGEGVGGEEVLEKVVAYFDDWVNRKAKLQQSKVKLPMKDTQGKRRSPLFGGKPAIPDNHLIGVTSSGAAGGSYFAWNFATALAKQGNPEVVLINAEDTTLAAWTHLKETRRMVLKGQGEEARHFGVKVGIATTPMSEEEWVLAARMSLSQTVIVDLTKMSEPPLERVETWIDVRDCDPAHNQRLDVDATPHFVVMNRVPDGLPIQAEDVLMAPPNLTLADAPTQQVLSIWTGRPMVVDQEDLAQEMMHLYSELSKQREGQLWKDQRSS